MKKALKIAALVFALGFVAAQFVRPDFDNPPVDPAKTLAAAAEVPEAVERILDRSCRDCHSNETRLPRYSYLQPSASFLASHIDDGRRELNFSVWATYEKSRRRRKLDEICREAEAREMPLPSYLWIHRAARLSDEEIRTLCRWTEAESARLGE